MKAFLFLCLLLWSTTAMSQSLPQNGDHGFEYSSAYAEPLGKCVLSERVAGKDISTCRGLVERLCADRVLSGSTTKQPLSNCLLEEQFAWNDLLRATTPDLIGVVDGKTIPTAEAYISELQERFPRLREKCLSFSKTQLDEANRCQIEATIQDVIWHFELYDNGLASLKTNSTAGRSLAADDTRIDNKDEPGEYRAAVFDQVQNELGFSGEPPSGPAIFLGDWVTVTQIHGLRPTEPVPPSAVRSFLEDGTTPLKAVDGSFEYTKDRWVLNDDGSFSIWAFVEPMPEYGIFEPMHSEDRYHVIMNGSDKFVLFNGDGSLMMLYERVSTK